MTTETLPPQEAPAANGAGPEENPRGPHHVSPDMDAEIRYEMERRRANALQSDLTTVLRQLDAANAAIQQLHGLAQTLLELRQAQTTLLTQGLSEYTLSDVLGGGDAANPTRNTPTPWKD